MDKKRVYSLFSVMILALFLMAGTVFLWSFINQFNGNPQLLKEAVDAYGEGNSAVVFLIVQVLQVVFPILPGEMIEVGAGYVFGPFLGLLMCEIGILISSVPIFFLVKKFGIKLVSNIFPEEKLKSLSFLQNEKRIVFITFLLFFIPGTPKDLLTYFVGLTPIKASSFILITLFARVPSILTSTFVGANIGSGKSQSALLIYAVTAALSVVGMLIYSLYTRCRTKSHLEK